MNIFYIDKNPKIAAQCLGDKHVVKMVLESAQMLCTAQRHYGNDNDWLYKACYQNHPCNVYIRNDWHGYRWLFRHFMALCEEFEYRFGKKHKCDSLFFADELSKNPVIYIGDVRCNIPLCMPDQYKTTDPVESYRNYYIHEKKHLHKWTKREKPNWIGTVA